MKVITFFNNEKQLIKKAAKGDREAQRRLYELHSPKMLSVCRRYLKDSMQAEEAMCNGFLKVFKNLDRFRDEGSFEGWVRRIMVNESISYLRKEQKMIFTDYDNQGDDPTYNPQNSDLEVEHIQLLIDQLPEGYRAVFVMYAIEGYKHQEIANMLEIAESTSKSQLFKARKLLQQKLSELNTYKYGADKI
ncbi:RNA polymerase sigma-70 factor (ECF subfamily) [Leeuwenhoekiella aestuarii]|uniref:RNA polymerase sigma-70 factor (ECF subfamily) n=1 Tax=Leeuwenhoekiella aestuarii TaxID=2249426 RepID=A0A4Q0NSP4_9FLAO|nr:RNA polymerase sigma factor [Leeuwenhoekiella aestuarii]RXG14012.1 RNA polymerase sigma-70 factor (ECF subfamily) [Leeuwenhoekiella aestuarii]RXG18761.1 RNA polymerase sigma-70 factor (ECF subfamily) [Leeuwenhoekiella aestuarii]